MLPVEIIIINVNYFFSKKIQNREIEGDLHNLRSQCNRPSNIPHSYIVHCFTNYITCTVLHKYNRYLTESETKIIFFPKFKEKK